MIENTLFLNDILYIIYSKWESRSKNTIKHSFFNDNIQFGLYFINLRFKLILDTKFHFFLNSEF